MKICVISYHTSPLAPPGTGTSGGMNVYLAQLYERLSLFLSIDIFVHGRHKPTALNRNLRVITIPDHNHASFARRILDHHALSQYDLVHTHYWLSGMIGRTIRARTGIPWIHSFHTIEHLKGHIADQHRVEAEHEIIKRCDFIISPTQRERIEILKINPETRVLVIPHGVNTRAFTASRNGHKRLLFVGRITRIKGLDVLIDALRYLEHDTELTVVGGPAQDRDTFDSIRTYARGLPVNFVGAVPHEVLHDFYRSSSIVIMPSFYESFGLVALEAMSSARPVIGFQDTGLIETVGNTAGILVRRYERTLAQAIAHILHNDKIGMTLGVQARIRALQFDWQYVADTYRKTYETIGKN
jgi:D-inositol-3-phosphate glycosyltransferase